MSKDNKKLEVADEEMLDDIAKIKGLSAKEWSVKRAKELGLSDEEIEKYLSAKS